jgi:hypothetical protein
VYRKIEICRYKGEAQIKGRKLKGTKKIGTRKTRKENMEAVD